MNKKFMIGDLVKVKGYPQRKFEVIKIKQTSKYNSMTYYSSETIYFLKDVVNQEVIIGFPEDMEIYSDENEEYNFQYTVNSALDKYNDEMSLYYMFGDEEYKEQADNILKMLKDYCNERDSK